VVVVLVLAACGATAEPAALPGAEPTDAPLAVPPAADTAAPTGTVAVAPTDVPTAVPTDAPTAMPTEGPTVVPTDEPMDMATAAPTAAATGEPAALPTAVPGDEAEVEMEDFQFQPKVLVIRVGTEVKWSNKDDAAHTATSDTGVWDSGYLNKGDDFFFTFTEPGTYPYYCIPHGGPGGVGMSGTVVVVE